MSETVAIILRFREEQADEFERLFREEVLPLWHEFKAQGKFIAASLTPVQEGNQRKAGVRDYILHVEVPSRAEHEEFDSHARFMEFLPKARLMQPGPLRWSGPTLYQLQPQVSVSARRSGSCCRRISMTESRNMSGGIWL